MESLKINVCLSIQRMRMHIEQIFPLNELCDAFIIIGYIDWKMAWIQSSLSFYLNLTVLRSVIPFVLFFLLFQFMVSLAIHEIIVKVLIFIAKNNEFNDFLAQCSTIKVFSSLEFLEWKEKNIVWFSCDDRIRHSAPIDNTFVAEQW